jgi:hypothetical protein
MIQIKAVDFALLVGAGATVATAIVTPTYTGAALAFLGGLAGGSAVVTERKYKREDEIREAERVTQCFRTLYDKNRGIIDPVELAILSNTPIDKSHSFLSSICEESGGQKVPSQQGTGVLFSFPHTNNALDSLSKNASAWAQAQTQSIQQELDQHKKAIGMLRAQQAAAIQQQNKQQEVNKPDPWQAPGL